MLGVIKLFLAGRLALLATGVLGVLPTVFGVFGFCRAGVFRGVLRVDFSLDGVFVEGLPNVIQSSFNMYMQQCQRDLAIYCITVTF